MITEKTWEDFRKTGLLLIINQVLHIFGWALIFETDATTEKCSRVYPARVKFRGFEHDDSGEAYVKVTEYLKNNIDELHKEINE